MFGVMDDVVHGISQRLIVIGVIVQKAEMLTCGIEPLQFFETIRLDDSLTV